MYIEKGKGGIAYEYEISVSLFDEPQQWQAKEYCKPLELAQQHTCGRENGEINMGKIEEESIPGLEEFLNDSDDMYVINNGEIEFTPEYAKKRKELNLAQQHFNDEVNKGYEQFVNGTKEEKI